MPIRAKEFHAGQYKKVRLKQWPTRVKPFYASQAEYKAILQRRVEELSRLQQIHYAVGNSALLVIFQGMDTAGKDGVIRHVISGVNPQGCIVSSFKEPSSIELRHDFLWRAALCLPEKGKIGIFNRSYYEDVLVVRVHSEAQGAKIDWQERYRSINGFERHLHKNGTRIVKIFLHLSKEEQRTRLLKRIDDPAKNWKLGENDVKERAFWKQYREAYEACIEATSTEQAPWHIVPADDKENARLIVAQIMINILQALGLHYPKMTRTRLKELRKARLMLLQERK